MPSEKLMHLKGYIIKEGDNGQNMLSIYSLLQIQSSIDYLGKWKIVINTGKYLVGR